MKKTLTVNLGGRVYHIDEDAYVLLNDYLESLKSHFIHEEGADEIIEDIEARIAEIFTERLKYGMHVISIFDIEDVIKILGQPSEFESDVADAVEEETKSGSAGKQDVKPEPVLQPKRLFRDPDNRFIGGVASGLSHYFNMDVTIIRILFVLLAILWGSSIMIYLILWIIVPEADTVSQKLEMKGEQVNVESIKNAIIDEKDKSGSTNQSSETKPKSGVTRFFNGFLDVVKNLLQVVMVLIGSCLGLFTLIIILPIIILLFALPFSGVDFITSTPFGVPFIGSFIAMMSNPILSLTGFLLVLVIPLYALLRAISCKLFNFRPHKRSTNIALFVLWVIGVIIVMVTLLKIAPVVYFHTTNFGY